MTDGKIEKSHMVAQAQDMQASRLNAAAAIEEHIMRLRQRADGLEALLNALPRELPPKADEALWQLVIHTR